MAVCWVVCVSVLLLCVAVELQRVHRHHSRTQGFQWVRHRSQERYRVMRV